MKMAAGHRAFRRRVLRSATNEKTCPYHVEIPVAALPDVVLGELLNEHLLEGEIEVSLINEPIEVEETRLSARERAQQRWFKQGTDD